MNKQFDWQKNLPKMDMHNSVALRNYSHWSVPKAVLPQWLAKVVDSMDRKAQSLMRMPNNNIIYPNNKCKAAAVDACHLPPMANHLAQKIHLAIVNNNTVVSFWSVSVCWTRRVKDRLLAVQRWQKVPNSKVVGFHGPEPRKSINILPVPGVFAG